MINIFAKENGLEQAYLPKLKAKYEKALNDAMKKDGKNSTEVWECTAAMDEVERYNRYETRIAPSAQTFKKAQECQNSPDYWAGALNLTDDLLKLRGDSLGNVSATSKVQAQMKADYDNYVFGEFQKHSAKFTKDEDILAYVKNV